MISKPYLFHTLMDISLPILARTVCGLAATTALLSGCGGVEIKAPVSWGGTNIVQADNLYFAGQPDQKTLEAARDAGIDIVINMRLPNELEWDEAAAVRELGVQYLSMPVSKTGPGFDSAVIESLHDIVTRNADRNILLHCSTGNRVSAWYALYLVQKHGLSQEEALSIAAQTGLTRAGLVTRVEEYLR
ncbi:MAG: sulfur transferase domain-containing protein [Gammaproteobacteria bacterium]|nr:sulfur transferase domain-containing protein [Gammaproteobacteria bacterium]